MATSEQDPIQGPPTRNEAISAQMLDVSGSLGPKGGTHWIPSLEIAIGEDSETREAEEINKQKIRNLFPKT